MKLRDGDIYMVAQCRAAGNSLFSVGILLVIFHYKQHLLRKDNIKKRKHRRFSSLTYG